MISLKKRGSFFIFGVVIMVSGVLFLKESFSSFYKEVTTKSGLKILFLEDKKLPYIQYTLWFLKAGADYDYKDKSGLNVLTANLLEQGAGGLSSEVLQENIDYYGAYFKTDTNRQFSTITLSGLSWQAKNLWDLFLKIATEAHLEEKEFQLLRQQLLESRSITLDDDPSSVATEVWRRSFFSGSVAEPTNGTITSLKKIQLEDVKTYFKNHYLKSQAILTVVGQFDDSLKRQITSSFDEKTSKGTKEQDSLFYFEKPRFFKLLKKKDQVQSQVMIGFPTFVFPKMNPRIAVALKLANAVFGDGSFNSRLTLRLREEMGLTYAVWSGVSLGKFYGLFYLEAATKAESTGLFLKEALKLLKDFQERGVTKKELERVKLILKSRHLKSIETPEDRLERMVYYRYFLNVKDDSFVKNYVSLIEDISVEEVNEVIKEYLVSDKLSVVIYGDPSVKKQLLNIEGLNPLEEIFFKDYFSQELTPAN